MPSLHFLPARRTAPGFQPNSQGGTFSLRHSRPAAIKNTNTNQGLFENGGSAAFYPWGKRPAPIQTNLRPQKARGYSRCHSLVCRGTPCVIPESESIKHAATAAVMPITGREALPGLSYIVPRLSPSVNPAATRRCTSASAGLLPRENMAKAVRRVLYNTAVMLPLPWREYSGLRLGPAPARKPAVS